MFFSVLFDGGEHASWFGWMGNSKLGSVKYELSENIINFLSFKTVSCFSSIFVFFKHFRVFSVLELFLV